MSLTYPAPGGTPGTQVRVDTRASLRQVRIQWAESWDFPLLWLIRPRGLAQLVWRGLEVRLISPTINPACPAQLFPSASLTCHRDMLDEASTQSLPQNPLTRPRPCVPDLGANDIFV